MTATEHQKMTEACDILFGENFRLDKETFHYLQVSGIKSAYRQRVKSCHPDIVSEYKSEYQKYSEFCELKEAYDYLLDLKTGKTEAPRISTKERYYTAAIPGRKLRLGEYLYYSGMISWNALINALVWQKNHPLRIGNFFIVEKILRPAELSRGIINMNMHNQKVLRSA
ncbi:MAG: DnaJ domain-containing protein [Spirochaetales bacterium]|nr:DnaJ domain-containing protein [Spirochaetales bacterium]